jgi:PKD repeat protein
MPNSYWFDFDQISDGHAGTKADPFSFNDLQSHSNSNPSGNYYFGKGTYTSDDDINLNLRQNRWMGWSEYGYEETESGSIIVRTEDIWRVKAEGHDIYFNVEGEEEYDNHISGCYLWITDGSSRLIDLSMVYTAVNCIFRTGTTDVGVIVNAFGYIAACDFYGKIYDNGSTAATDFQDCIIEDFNVDTPSDMAFQYCACERSDFTEIYDCTECQEDWSMPDPPDFASEDPYDFDTAILCADVEAPPQPGTTFVACEQYTYPYGLFGTERSGIGAVYFPVLEVDFEGTPVSGDVPLTVLFTDLTDWGGEITSREWTFGDGSKETSENSTISHTYREPGIYTVSLKDTVENYNGALTFGNEPEPITDTETKVNYITVTQVDEKEQQSMCLRFATEENEGIGWSEYENDELVRPVDGGAMIISDDNDVERCVVEDEDSDIYEFSTFDRITNLKPQFTDKGDIDGESGTEINGSRWEREEVAGPGEGNKKILDEKSWIQVRPSDPENRDKDGYDSNGFRDEQAFGLESYVDGEKTYPGAVIDEVPENGDLVFPGVRVEGRRIQYVTKFAASEFKMVENKHLILKKDSAGSTAEKTMNEYTQQYYFEDEKILHITRGNLLKDIVSKESAIGSAETCEGADGYDDSALQGNGPILLPMLDGLSEVYFDFIFWIPNIEGSPTIKFAVDDGSALFSLVDYTPTINKLVSGWKLVHGEYSGEIPEGIGIYSSEYPFKIFDFRVFAKAAYETGYGVIKLAVLNTYYRDMSMNHGNAFLPAFVSL